MMSLRRQRPIRDDLVQRPAIDIFHGDVPTARLLSNLVDRADVRVVEGRGSARFPEEALSPLVICEELVAEEFESNLALELEVRGQVDLAHAARSERLEVFVLAERAIRHDQEAIPQTRRGQRSSPIWLHGRATREDPEILLLCQPQRAIRIPAANSRPSGHQTRPRRPE